MKKFILLVFLLLVFILSGTASATIIDLKQVGVDPSKIINATIADISATRVYAGEYDLIWRPAGSSDDGYDISGFCVERAYNNTSFSYYELISPDDHSIDLQNPDKIVYLADQYFNAPTADAWVYQIAIWELAWDSVTDLTKGNFITSDYSAAVMALIDSIKLTDFNPIDNWMVAHGPVGSDNPKYPQDYIVRWPVPEPATMLLLGSGLLGLALIGRMKFIKRS